MQSQEFAVLLGVINLMYDDMRIDKDVRYLPSEIDVMDTFNTIADEYITFMKGSRHYKKANQKITWITKVIQWTQENKLR